ncbi:hypothetical protein ECFDA504_2002, partial [Escherichia coli FDA504]
PGTGHLYLPVCIGWLPQKCLPASVLCQECLQMSGLLPGHGKRHTVCFQVSIQPRRHTLRIPVTKTHFTHRWLRVHLHIRLHFPAKCFHRLLPDNIPPSRNCSRSSSCAPLRAMSYTAFISCGPACPLVPSF